MFHERHRPPYVVAQALADEFLGTYAVGAHFNLMLHPRGDVGSGRGSRVRARTGAESLPGTPARPARQLPRYRCLDARSRAGELTHT